MDWETYNALTADWQRWAGRPREQTIQLQTTRREELFAISHLLFRSIDPAFLRDAANPITVALNGTPAGGKTIFRDVAVRTLLGKDKCLFEGRRNQEEIWRKEDGIHPIEVHFANARILFHPVTVEKFFQRRRHGGLTLISNAESVSTPVIGNKVGLLILLTAEEEPDMKDTFDRDITVATFDPRLLQSSRWRQGMEALRATQDWRNLAPGNMEDLPWPQKVGNRPLPKTSKLRL